MNTSKILYSTNKIVKEILETNIPARNSDTYLYLQVLYRVGKAKGIDVDTISVAEFLKNRSKLGIACFETVRRARQKIQAEHPELASSESVQAQKIINERVYRAYAQSKKIGD